MEPTVIQVWKLWTVYACMFVVTAILSCVIKIRGLFESTNWRHFEKPRFHQSISFALFWSADYQRMKHPNFTVKFLQEK